MSVKKNNSFIYIIEQKILSLSQVGRWFFSISLILLIIGSIGGIISISNIFTSPIPQRGGTYHEGITGTPRFINPVIAYSEADQDLTHLVYNGLVRLDESGLLIPDIAKSWEISPDGKIYTFTLKPDLVFHDKKPITAYDVVFTVESIQNPLIKSPLRVAWTGIIVSAPDAQTVIFELPKAYSGFLNQATLGIVPAHLWRTIGSAENWQTSQLNTEPIGSGPYRVTDVDRTKTGIPESYTLQAFKKFSLGEPFISKVIISSFVNTDELIDAFIDKTIDGFTSSDMVHDRIVDKPWVTVTTQPATRIFSIFLNGEKSPLLQDQSVIRALKLATPKQEIIKDVFGGFANPLNGPLPIFVEQESDTSELIIAEEILEKAGWKKDPITGIRMKGTQKLSFTFSTANTPDLRKSAEIITSTYESIGVEIDLQFYNLGTLQETIIRKRDFQMLLFGQVMKHDTDLFAFWHSSQRTDPGLNIVNYLNTKVDTLLEKALVETDRDVRIELYEQVNKELATAPVIFLYSPQTSYFTKDSVGGISMPPASGHADRFASIHTWFVRTQRVWNWFLR